MFDRALHLFDEDSRGVSERLAPHLPGLVRRSVTIVEPQLRPTTPEARKTRPGDAILEDAKESEELRERESQVM